ncbi:MAG: cytochrome c [Deltaproteobacteria bacterium]|nr:cytochrome c [Deltaproteobacteria bacterium]MBW2387876.1 cytochrome c [Deltaproteobacteria bacterium]
MKRTTLAVCILACALACAGSPDPGLLASCPSGDRDSPEPDPSRSARGDTVRGGVLFGQECNKCHSRLVIERGSRLFRGYPRLDCPDFLTGVSDSYLHRVISKGGKPVGLDSAMKPFEEKLSADEIADLVAYLRAISG